MTALVVYESSPATRALAEAIAEGLRTSGPVRVEEVGVLAATPGARNVARDAALLVVGSPTYPFGMGRPKPADSGPAAKGLTEWLDELILPTGGLPVATFETKAVKPNLPGSSARTAEKRLRQMGGRPVDQPRTFKLQAKSDELAEGELATAHLWGQQLGSTRARLH